MIRRLLMVLKFILVYLSGFILFIPFGVIWVFTGSTKPFDWLERVAEKNGIS